MFNKALTYLFTSQSVKLSFVLCDNLTEEVYPQKYPGQYPGYTAQ